MNALIIGEFGLELIKPRGGELIETDFPISFGDSPLRVCPAFQEDSLERRIKRAFLHLEHFGRKTMDALSDRITVQGSGAQNTKNEQNQRPSRHIFLRHIDIMGRVVNST